jgi:hypothetical protein
MPSRQLDGEGFDGEGDAGLLAGVLCVPAGLVAGVLEGTSLVEPPVGGPEVPPLGDVPAAGALVAGCADGLFDGFFPCVACWPVAAGVAAVLGPAVPPGADVLPAPDARSDGIRPVVGAPVVEDPAGDWFAAGEPANAPETSSATRPALAAAAAPTAIAAPARRRGFPDGRPG